MSFYFPTVDDAVMDRLFQLTIVLSDIGHVLNHFGLARGANTRYAENLFSGARRIMKDLDDTSTKREDEKTRLRDRLHAAEVRFRLLKEML